MKFDLGSVWDRPYSGIRIQTFTSKNYTFWCYKNSKENFSIVSGQNVLDYLPKFASKEKSGGYSVYSYSRIGSIEHAHLSHKSAKLAVILSHDWPKIAMGLDLLPLDVTKSFVKSLEELDAKRCLLSNQCCQIKVGHWSKWCLVWWTQLINSAQKAGMSWWDSFPKGVTGPSPKSPLSPGDLPLRLVKYVYLCCRCENLPWAWKLLIWKKASNDPRTQQNYFHLLLGSMHQCWLLEVMIATLMLAEKCKFMNTMKQAGLFNVKTLTIDLDD